MIINYNIYMLKTIHFIPKFLTLTHNSWNSFMSKTCSLLRPRNIADEILPTKNYSLIF